MIELLVVIAIISLLVSILLPSLSRAKDLARLAVCSGSMRVLGLSMHMYLEENDAAFPAQFAEGVLWREINDNGPAAYIDTDIAKPSGNFMTSDNKYIEHFRTWMDDLHYDLAIDVYRCPAAQERNSQGHPLPSYGYAGGLSAYVDEVPRSLDDIRRPPDTFMFMDANNFWAPLSNPSMFPDWFRTHGDDEVHMIFVDSHVGMVDAHEPAYTDPDGWWSETWGWY